MPRRSSSVLAARAFAPGHITVLFAPRTHAKDPRARGSIGAGIVLSVGVYAEATWDAEAPRALVMNSHPSGPVPISRDAARRLVGRRRGRLEVRLTHALPVSQGFGMSAAGALATALATARVLNLPAGAAMNAAHLADLEGRGGLGGVSAILGGGMELRHRAGIPPRGRITHRAWRPPVYYAVVGRPLPSPALLRDRTFLRRANDAARGELRRLGRRPTERDLLQAGGTFAARLGLGNARIDGMLRELRSEGHVALQTMFGQVIYAVPFGTAEERRLRHAFRRLGLRAVRVGAGPAGARLLTLSSSP